MFEPLSQGSIKMYYENWKMDKVPVQRGLRSDGNESQLTEHYIQ